MKTALAAVLAASAILTGTATASTPIYWSPTKMANALIALQYPHQGLFSGTCKGASKQHHHAYSAFRCSLKWQLDGPPLTSGTVRVFARPLVHGRVCGSTSSLKACRPLKKGPLANDPRVCSVDDPVRCAQAASKATVVAKDGPQVNLVCTEAGSVLVWSCTSSSGTVKVTWAKGLSSWIAKVTP